MINSAHDGSDYTPTADTILAQSGFGSRYRNLVPAGPSAMAVPVPAVPTPVAPTAPPKKPSAAAATSAGAAPEKPSKPKSVPKPPKPSATTSSPTAPASVSVDRGVSKPLSPATAAAAPPPPPPRASGSTTATKAPIDRPALKPTNSMSARPPPPQPAVSTSAKTASASAAASPTSRPVESLSMFERIQKLSFREAETTTAGAGAATTATTSSRSAVGVAPPPAPARPLSRAAVLEELMDGEEKLTDRTIIREGDLQKLSRRGFTSMLFVLTNDALIYCSHVLLTNKLKHHRTIPLSGVLLSNAEDSRPDAGMCFKVMTKSKSFYIQASSTAERNAWYSDIESAASKEQLKANVRLVEAEMAPILDVYENASECKLCSISFSIMNWRHHCRNCGEIVCAECSREKLKTKTGDKQLLRVCNACAETLKDNRTYGVPKQVK